MIIETYLFKYSDFHSEDGLVIIFGSLIHISDKKEIEAKSMVNDIPSSSLEEEVQRMLNAGFEVIELSQRHTDLGCFLGVKRTEIGQFDNPANEKT